MSHVVYILQCKDGTLYTGYTNNLAKRLRLHNEGKGAKYTRGRTPVTLVYVEEIPSMSSGLKREYEIKHMCRKQKYHLIQSQAALHHFSQKN
ncbi:GIY-YIG nuclease family protein [Fodinisporobacter ferrooxydans]|uniref:GIY-YIG nuclease family protein n=1 Tax=Fodinisporobacter ferrooxydans TaxID=2901836 RepID=A0ABY4CLA7_9BACL|nr:GIY-YIG nuclease family protein [Alicyclobacillaceae bacterium MYW30-H2]